MNFVAIISWFAMRTFTHNRSALVKLFRDSDLEGRLRLNTWQSNGEQRSGLALSAWKCEPMGQIGKRAPMRPAARSLVGAEAV